jgi:hypothetical protein
MRTDVLAAVIVTILTISGLQFPPASADEVSSVSERELRQLFPGQFQVVVRGFLKVHITASRDGSLFARQIGKSDTGRWAIRAGTLCIRFSKWLKGRTRCSPVTERAGWYRTADVVFRKKRNVALASP